MVQQFWRRFFFYFVYVFLLFRNYLPLEKGGAHLNKLESPSPKDVLCQGCFVPSFVEHGPVVLEKIVCIFAISLLSLLVKERGPSIHKFQDTLLFCEGRNFRAHALTLKWISNIINLKYNQLYNFMLIKISCEKFHFNFTQKCSRELQLILLPIGMNIFMRNSREFDMKFTCGDFDNWWR